jgi:hypothetical protein
VPPTLESTLTEGARQAVEPVAVSGESAAGAGVALSGNPRDALGSSPAGTGGRLLWKPFTQLELARAVRGAIDAAGAPPRSA